MTHAIKPALPENAGGLKTWGVEAGALVEGPRALGLGSAVTAIAETLHWNAQGRNSSILSTAQRLIQYCFTVSLKSIEDCGEWWIGQILMNALVKHFDEFTVNRRNSETAGFWPSWASTQI